MKKYSVRLVGVDLWREENTIDLKSNERIIEFSPYGIHAIIETDIPFCSRIDKNKRINRLTNIGKKPSHVTEKSND